MRLHIHRDPNWQQRGVWAEYRCRCGARRLRRNSFRLYGPIPTTWDVSLMRDRHGRVKDDSGWVTAEVTR